MPLSMPLPVPAESRSVGSPIWATVPLGPDEPELFSDALQRIIHRLEQVSAEQVSAGQPGQATWSDRLASPNQ